MNWGQIKAAVREYAHRADISDTLLNTFLALAEQRMYYGEANTPKLRCAAMRATAVMYDGAQPGGYLEAIKIHQIGSPERPLNFLPLALMPAACNAFSWDGQNMVLSDDVSFPLEMTYYRRLPALMDDADSNWVSENAPSIYITAIGVEVGDWMRDSDYVVSQAAKYASACGSLTSSERASAISGSTLRIRGR